MLQIDSATLKSIAFENPASQTIFSALQSRQRTRKITDLRQFQYKLLDEGAKLTREDVMHTFKRLEEAGVGSLIVGRHGKPTRFKWNYSIKRIALAAKEKKEHKERKIKPAPSLVSKRYSGEELRDRVAQLIPATINARNISAVMSTSIKIREGFSAKLEIPLDITMEDADKLSEVIHSLVQTPKNGGGTRKENIKISSVSVSEDDSGNKMKPEEIRNEEKPAFAGSA